MQQGACREKIFAHRIAGRGTIVCKAARYCSAARPSLCKPFIYSPLLWPPRCRRSSFPFGTGFHCRGFNPKWEREVKAIVRKRMRIFVGLRAGQIWPLHILVAIGMIAAFSLAAPRAHADEVTFSFSGTLAGCVGCTSTEVSGQFSFSVNGSGAIQSLGAWSFNTPFGRISSRDTGNFDGFEQAGGETVFSFANGNFGLGFGFRNFSISSLNALDTNKVESFFVCGEPSCSSGTIALSFAVNQPFVSGSAGPISPTPEPASLLLLGSGLLFVGGLTRRKFSRRTEP